MSALGVVAAANGGLAQGLVWREAAAPGVSDCRMVFDTVRDRFVAVGVPLVAQSLTTVEWDGAGWRGRPTATAPSARSEFALAFDEQRGRAVLFGGMSRGAAIGALLDDTWEYDGADWIERPTALRPPPRYAAAMTWDPVRGVVLLAGGAVPVWTTDVWSWNGTAWQQLPGSAPPLSNPEIASHPSSGRIVMVGNLAQAAETWTFDGTAWSATTAPTPYGAEYRAATDAVGNRIVLLSADTAAPSTWNGTAWTPMTAGLDGRRRCGLAADAGGNVLVFAGQLVVQLGLFGTPVPRNDTWRLGASAHQRIDNGGPIEIAGAQIAFDSARQRLLSVGQASPTSVPNEAWEFDGSHWRSVGAATPPPRIDARVCYDAIRARTVRFGGGTPGFLSIVPTDELSEWDGVQWTSPAGPRPPARMLHSMAFDITHGAVVMFGGVGTGGVALGDTWTWDGTNWTQRPVLGPPPRSDAAIAADLVLGRVVLFGGRGPVFGSLFGDTWDWDGANWTQRAPAIAPSPRRQAAMGFDFASLRTLLVGGSDNLGLVHDQWQWNGFQWQQLNGTASPNPYASANLVFDSSGRAIMASMAGTWFGHPFAATSRVEGIACGGTFVPALRAEGDPVLGSMLRATLHRAAPTTGFVLGIGIGHANQPLGGGCTLYLPQLDFVLQGLTSTGGYAQTPIVVPQVPALAGLEVSLQVGVFDGSGPLGIALSNAIVARLGN